ncbi:hypothetical protein EDL99_02055 [Ornithobacterium rhinotracheale]|uniref:hypothetical protein n=1 Tax=Ornithobacterium rhinotracheale TaxID=28251 RepID=UPI00129CF602|nr:hypothetical protein [Ornithobacterium rhinotracheale]MRJ07671.1 hypothetical protein [Ornithobacterium rhinotracheale]UOH78267.1 hypothetical protein MT996_02065 [Ornithobacterium rhinotracheale]
MKKISLLSMFLLSSLSFAQLYVDPGSDGYAPVTGGPRPVAPIDTNAIILIVAAVVLIIAMVAYKKMTASKMA